MRLRQTPKRIPVVLSVGEVAAVLANLPEKCRLAAELQYGAGLRRSELLNLRVKDIDLDRRQVTVRAGKGNRDRVTVLRTIQEILGHEDICDFSAPALRPLRAACRLAVSERLPRSSAPRPRSTCTWRRVRTGSGW